MTAVQVRTGTPALPLPRGAADDVLPAPPAPGSRAGAHQRVLHQVVRRELRLLADLLGWAPAAEPRRTRTLTGHADLVGRLLLAHHRLERDALWPALVDAVPDEHAAAVRAAVADWSVRSARIDAQVRDLATAARQWAVAGTPAARDVVARGCLRLADAVDAHTAAEERDLVPLLDAYLDTRRWAAVASAGACRLTGRERRLVLGLALEDSCAHDRARLLVGLPRRQRWAWRLAGARRYRGAVVRLRGAPPAA
ncbi:Hemerythrin HHE cation binding domain-containing protein [Blastococcus aurantiacus]|uniref:Hemerythrin HHE cation binding domain-containing protein n=1 Tax=Blastococcus aurantiacus TaxID=1550231 RepID=A0A1G7I522_9ACTN|nr:hemerythrin domain-containing protein [Blastococcus aurantiacus]SDF07606.1 Hemerythrin HHE cation binding domain-containing protein [Blastococcus aurantiacus]